MIDLQNQLSNAQNNYNIQSLDSIIKIAEELKIKSLELSNYTATLKQQEDKKERKRIKSPDISLQNLTLIDYSLTTTAKMQHINPRIFKISFMKLLIFSKTPAETVMHFLKNGFDYTVKNDRQ